MTEAGVPDFAAAFPGGVVDAHHHLYCRPGLSYLADDYSADITRAGLSLVASVLVQARSDYLDHGPDHLRVLGETRFALSQAERAAAAGVAGVSAGIVGAADLTLGAAVREVLEGHLALAGHAAQGGRYCGVRHILAWDADRALLNPAYPTTADMMDQAALRAGLAVVSDMNLSFDAWLLSPQIPRLVRLARAFPDLAVVLNHCGGPVGIGAYAGKQAEVFARWRADTAELARCERVSVKFGGLGMALSGLCLSDPERALGPDALARICRPWFEHLLDVFGPDRVMLESNAPAERAGYPFAWGWQCFARLLEPLSAADRQALCRSTATRVYRLDAPGSSPSP